MVLGRFSLMEVWKHTNTVPWYGMVAEDAQTGLVGFPKRVLRRKKKRPVNNVSPETDNNYPPRQPLIAI